MNNMGSTTTPRRTCALSLLVVLAMAASAARADSIASYNVFAGHAITAISGSLNDPTGVIGSNGDLFLSGATAKSVRAGGSIYDNFGAVTTTGDVTINGNALMTFSGSIGGNLNVGGGLNTTANVAGNIVAGGNVVSNGNVTGSIKAGGSISLGLSATVGAGTFPFSPVSPPAFTPVDLPSSHSFSAGATNVNLALFDTRTLSPGSYGELTMIGSNTVYLSAGDYYFSDIRSLGSFVTFNFETTQGPINIFVTGDVFLISAEMKLNGAAFNSVPGIAASQIYWETHANFAVQFTNLLGTVYAPNGDINFTSLSKANGNLYAGHDIVTDGGSFTAGAVSPTLLVPEPSSAALCLIALAGLAMTRPRRLRPRMQTKAFF